MKKRLLLAALAVWGLSGCHRSHGNTGSINVRSIIKATKSGSHGGFDCPIQLKVDAGPPQAIPDGIDTLIAGLDAGQHVLLFSSTCGLQQPGLKEWKCLVLVKEGQVPQVVLSDAAFGGGVSIRCP